MKAEGNFEKSKNCLNLFLKERHYQLIDWQIKNNLVYAQNEGMKDEKPSSKAPTVWFTLT
jgi:hypothetical protein